MVTAVLLVLVLVVLVFFFVVGYNSLVKLRNKVENAWAQVQVAVQRRHDLIPNLVETVKGYAAHEQEALTNVTEMRAKAMAAQRPGEKAEAEQQLGQALANIQAVAEAYPDLKADRNFRELQQELAGTEDMIAAARRGYNDAVKRYDIRRQQIPWNIIAAMGTFGDYEYYEAGPEAQGPVEVSF